MPNQGILPAARAVLTAAYGYSTADDLTPVFVHDPVPDPATGHQCVGPVDPGAPIGRRWDGSSGARSVHWSSVSSGRRCGLMGQGQHTFAG